MAITIVGICWYNHSYPKLMFITPSWFIRCVWRVWYGGEPTEMGGVTVRIWASRLFFGCPIKIQMSPTNMRIHLNFNNGKCGLNHQIRVSSAKLLDCASIKWWFPFSIITYIYTHIIYIYTYGVLKMVGSPETIGFNTNMVYCWMIWGYSHDLGNLPIP